MTSASLWDLLPASTQGMEETLPQLIQKSRHAKRQLAELKQLWSQQEFSDEEATEYKRVLEANAQDLARAIQSCVKLMGAVSITGKAHKKLKELHGILTQHYETTQDLIEDLALIPELRQRLKSAKSNKGKSWRDVWVGLKSG